MRVGAALAAVAAVALVIALLTGATAPAVLVVAAALAGIVSLVRDRPGGAPEPRHAAQHPEPPAVTARPSADDLSPDISTDPDGPSSDARADHV
jgi:hypothetical protein